MTQLLFARICDMILKILNKRGFILDIKERIKSSAKESGLYTAKFLKWLVLGLIIGAICGGLGAVFGKALTFATVTRSEHHELLWLLPVGGIISVAIYKLCKTTDIGTNQVFESVREERRIPMALAPAIFSGTVLTHLFGGSAGREGAALQLGGSVAATMSKILKLDTKSHHILTLSGMGAFFSALFGTPIGAAVFALEVVSVGQFCSAAIFPCAVASVTAFKLSTALGTHPERFTVNIIPQFNWDTLWKVAVIAALEALTSIVFCKAMHYTSHYFKRFFKNEFLRIIVGSAIIIALTLLLGTYDYNGGGIEVIDRIFNENSVRYEAFILKIIFTAITIGCGFKGGEIVPTIFIGATLGAALSLLLGLPLGFGAAIGISALLCGVTNCPLATIFLSIELFGSEGLVFYTLSAVTSFILSGYSSLYTGQKLFFSKLNDEIIDRNAD